MEIGAFGEWLGGLQGRSGSTVSECTQAVSSAGQSPGLQQGDSPGSPLCVGDGVDSCCRSLSLLLPSERSQDSTAVALSDSSSTQDFFNEPASSLEGSRKPYVEKRPPSIPSSQAGLTSKDLQGATEERGMRPNWGIRTALMSSLGSAKDCGWPDFHPRTSTHSPGTSVGQVTHLGSPL